MEKDADSIIRLRRIFKEDMTGYEIMDALDACVKDINDGVITLKSIKNNRLSKFLKDYMSDYKNRSCIEN